ncbi:hypothetical protein Pcinc_015612 [Petrolisthes cinctipes]|uniref:Uncharacterized protein n=1 Tax=Petrolisthes cinctipes TaxID=88211 RepID=A0AAE1FUL1_PETCI|nr:hypothetical protein Pcinc_015612 [Petrolisthes cinctipes]
MQYSIHSIFPFLFAASQSPSPPDLVLATPSASPSLSAPEPSPLKPRRLLTLVTFSFSPLPPSSLAEMGSTSAESEVIPETPLLSRRPATWLVPPLFLLPTLPSPFPDPLPHTHPVLPPPHGP